MPGQAGRPPRRLRGRSSSERHREGDVSDGEPGATPNPAARRQGVEGVAKAEREHQTEERRGNSNERDVCHIASRDTMWETQYYDLPQRRWAISSASKAKSSSR